MSSDIFPKTRWSLVLRAQESVDTPTVRKALEDLCQAYWMPLYGYARSRGASPQDAEDQTQGFFEHLLKKDSLQSVAQEKGKLRAFLLTAMNRFLTNQWRRDRAEKRGGGTPLISIDRELAERQLDKALEASESPDRAFDKHWALSLLDAVLAKLEAYYAQRGRQRLFEALRESLLWNAQDTSYREVGSSVGMSESGVRSAVFQMRQRFRRYLEEEIRETVASASDAEEELRHLREILSQR